MIKACNEEATAEGLTRMRLFACQFILIHSVPKTELNYPTIPKNFLRNGRVLFQQLLMPFCGASRWSLRISG